MHGNMDMTLSDRTILHCDCNSFFASVELLKYPHLKLVPAAVCGHPQDKRGVILAKNEPAKAMGVQTGEAIYLALKKCPQLTLLASHHHEYTEFSKKLNVIYESYTSQVEPFGIDESWLDVTDSLHLFGSGRQIADEIRQRVKDELGLTVSVGVSFNKMFAKMGSDYKKPDATTEINRDNFKEILYPLPASALLFVGKAAASRLSRVGIRTIGDLAAATPEILFQLLGKQGPQLYAYAHGQDDSPVASITDIQESKSIGKGMTFSNDLTSISEAKAHLLWLSDQVAGQLRRQKLTCHNVQISIKNPQLKTITRQKMLAYPTALTRDLYQSAITLLESNWHFQTPIRMLTVTAQHLHLAGQLPAQMSLLDEMETQNNDKQAILETSIDQIRDKFGSSMITFGRLIRKPDDEQSKTDDA